MPRSGPVVADETVFSALVEVIGEVGPTRLTLARVGQRAGLTAGALVIRFGSRQGLLNAFAARSVADVAGVFAAAERRHAHDPRSAAVEGLVGLCRALADRRTFAHHLGWFALELADADLRVHAVAHARSVRRELTRLLGDEGEARHLHAVQQGALILWALEPAGEAAEFVGRELRAAGSRRPG